MADPVVLQKWSVYWNDAPTTIPTTPPSPLTPGSSIVALAVSPFSGSNIYNSFADSANGTWPTLFKEYTDAGLGDLWYAALPSNASSGQPSFSVSVSSSYSGYTVTFYEVSGADTAALIEVVNHIANAYGTNGRTGSLTTGNRDLILAIVVDVLAAGGVQTPDAGFTRLALASGNGCTIDGMKDAGTFNVGITFAVATASIGMALAIKPAAGGAAATSLPPPTRMHPALIAQ